jgi:hypothetical protein
MSNWPEFMSNLAASLRRQGNHSEAKAVEASASAGDPDPGPAWDPSEHVRHEHGDEDPAHPGPAGEAGSSAPTHADAGSADAAHGDGGHAGGSGSDHSRSWTSPGGHAGGDARDGESSEAAGPVRADPVGYTADQAAEHEQTPRQAGIDRDDPLAGLWSERLRGSIERQAFQQTDSLTQDALIAERALGRTAADFAEPGRFLSPVLAELLGRVAAGEVTAPSAETLASTRTAILREIGPMTGPAAESAAQPATLRELAEGRADLPASPQPAPAVTPTLVRQAAQVVSPAPARGADRER